MSDVCVKTEKKARSQLAQQRSIYRVHYALERRQEEVTARPLAALALDVRAYGRQVAGHMHTQGDKYLGVLQCNNGTILKPIIKESQKREVDFYNRLTTSEEADLVELRNFTPKYFGCRRFEYNGHEQEYIVLQDETERMLEPCIMDVKIGKRTWDPLATEAKIASEQAKYAACRREFGFCIPGYQVYKLSTGELLKYSKEFGKKLHGNGVVQALRNFLNGTSAPLCRVLVLQFVSQLWRIQKWARRQAALRLYSASALLVYDATRLRACCGDLDDGSRAACRGPPTRAVRRTSSATAAAQALPDTSFSGQLSPKGPVFGKVSPVPIAPMAFSRSFTHSPPHTHTSPWGEALDSLHHNHSFDHNYEEKVCKIKMNYRALLEQLSDDTPNPNPWGTVKIIDFAHAFFNEDDDKTIDENFKEGIDNLVEIFEIFLKETDDQVF